MPIPHPWRDLAALTHVVVHWRDLHTGTWGATNGLDRIWLDKRLLQVERRCTLAHELEHIRRGHRGCQPPVVEQRVAHAAARYLLPDPHQVADALVWAGGCVDEAADELWVDPPTLEARLDPRHLHPAEKAIIVGRLAEVDTWA